MVIAQKEPPKCERCQREDFIFFRCIKCNRLVCHSCITFEGKDKAVCLDCKE